MTVEPAPQNRTVWLPGDQSHAVGRLRQSDLFRGPVWSVPRGEQGVAASCAASGVASEDSAVLCQIAHRARAGALVAVIRVTCGGKEEVREVRAEPVQTLGWQRVAIRFRGAAEHAVVVSLESTGERLGVGSIVFWKRCSRPVWNIAHMSNSVATIREDLALGANALECDVGASDGNANGPLMAFHRFAPPYLRRSMGRTELRELVVELNRSLDTLALVAFDCHELRDDAKDYRTFGRRLAEAVRDYVPAERSLVSVEDESMAGVFRGLQDAGFAAGRDLYAATNDSDSQSEHEREIQAAEREGATTLGIGTDCFTPFDLLRNLVRARAPPP